MSLRSHVRLFLVLSIGLNLPGLLALSAPAAKPLEILTLVILPLVALWGLPGVLLARAHPGLFEVTEFGVYPIAPSAWALVFAAWVLIALALATVISAVRLFVARTRSPGRPR
jgi:hypothetical protein